MYDSRRIEPKSTIQKRQRVATGFTLIELMIVVAIIGILAAIAYPSYRNSVIKSDRSDAKVALATTAQAMERCYTQYNSYTDSNCPSFPANSPQNFYTITAPSSVATPTTFELVAAPSNTSPQKDDDHCQKFTLDSTGRRTAESTSGTDTTSKCW